MTLYRCAACGGEIDRRPRAPESLWYLLLSALRYSMGRCSTAPSSFVEAYRRHGVALRPEQRRQIAEEIREELDRAERGGGTLGHRCDHDLWRELADEIEP